MSDAARETVLLVENFEKTFRVGFLQKRVHAVRGVSFRVERGEVFGLLGPNGAGKTTTLKAVLGLIRPSSGSIRLFGQAAGDRRARQRLGYLPENPYVYQYLKAQEFLDLCGRLLGMEKTLRAKRTTEMLERVGLTHALDRPIGKFSKGMMQRVGLAQALLHDPDLLILDEPMSGLDPIGRKEVREILVEEQRRGKTLLLTSHILSDIEMLCDHVAIVNSGKVTANGALSTLLKPEVRRVEIELENVSSPLSERLVAASVSHKANALRLHLIVEGEADADRVVKDAVEGGARIVGVTQQKETLEDLFVRNAMADHKEA